MNKPVQFFLRCDPDANHFYVVEIYDSPESMHRAVRRLNPPGFRQDESLEACCLRYVVKPSRQNRELQKRYNQIGTIFFIRGQIPVATVVHELTHAAIGWARRAKVNPMKPSKVYAKCQEERFVRTLQYLVEQFYQKAPPALAEADA